MSVERREMKKVDERADSQVGIIAGAAVAVLVCMVIVIIMVVIFIRRCVLSLLRLPSNGESSF